MTTPSPVQIDRKIRQLDNDVQSIYEMLAGIAGTQLRHGNRLDELGAKLEAVDARFDGTDARFDGMDAKLDTIITALGDRTG